MLYIIIPVHNRIDLTRDCLRSLERQVFRGFRVVVVDDGSTDGTQPIISHEFGDRLAIDILVGSGTLFWGGAVELGMRHVLSVADQGDYLMTLNNDACLPATFLEKAAELCERYPEAMIGGLSCSSSGEDQVAITGWRMRCWPLALTERVWWPMTTSEVAALREEVIDVDFVPGTAVLSPVKWVRRAGPVNGRLLPHYASDSEFSWRMKRYGCRVLLARDLRFAHNLGTTGMGGDERARITIGQFLRSLTSVRSGNCLKYKWRFASACCPKWALPFFIIADTFKVFARGLAMCIGHDLASRLKQITNPPAA